MCKNIEVDGPVMTRHRELGRWKLKGLPAGACPITFHDDFGAIHLALKLKARFDFTSKFLTYSHETNWTTQLTLLSYVMLSMPQTGFISCVQMQLSCIAAMQGPSNATLV